jgi:hypothetical protein
MFEDVVHGHKVKEMIREMGLGQRPVEDIESMTIRKGIVLTISLNAINIESKGSLHHRHEVPRPTPYIQKPRSLTANNGSQGVTVWQIQQFCDPT